MNAVPYYLVLSEFQCNTRIDYLPILNLEYGDEYLISHWRKRLLLARG